MTNRILTNDTIDVHGNSVTDYGFYVGMHLKHTGNGKTYVVHGFAWNGDTDTWGFFASQLAELNAAMVWRPLSHLAGKRNNGETRYQIMA